MVMRNAEHVFTTCVAILRSQTAQLVRIESLPQFVKPQKECRVVAIQQGGLVAFVLANQESKLPLLSALVWQT